MTHMRWAARIQPLANESFPATTTLAVHCKNHNFMVFAGYGGAISAANVAIQIRTPTAPMPDSQLKQQRNDEAVALWQGPAQAEGRKQWRLSRTPQPASRSNDGHRMTGGTRR